MYIYIIYVIQAVPTPRVVQIGAVWPDGVCLLCILESTPGVVDQVKL